MKPFFVYLQIYEFISIKAVYMKTDDEYAMNYECELSF